MKNNQNKKKVKQGNQRVKKNEQKVMVSGLMDFENRPYSFDELGTTKKKVEKPYDRFGKNGKVFINTPTNGQPEKGVKKEYKVKGLTFYNSRRKLKAIEVELPPA